MEALLDKLPWGLLFVLCISIGLAPYNPPHVWEKLQMLAHGKLVRPLDWFDFLMHGTPWLLLIIKTLYLIKVR